MLLAKSVAPLHRICICASVPTAEAGGYRKDGRAATLLLSARRWLSIGCSGEHPFCAGIIRRPPDLGRQWRREWDSDSVANFDDMVMTVSASAVPQVILDDYYTQKNMPPQEEPEKSPVINFFRRILGLKPVKKVSLSATLILCWLYFGKSFESMYELVETQMKSGDADNMDKEKCAFARKQIINASIKGGYRTVEDWEDYFSQKKAVDSGDVSEWAISGLRERSGNKEEADNKGNAPVADEPMVPGRKKADSLPLAEYMECVNKDAVLDVIRRFITDNNTGNGLALPYFALSELGLFKRMIDAKEYSVGITKQFGDIGNLKSESSCRQALGNLRKQQFVVIDGRQRSGTLLESDEIAPKLERLKAEIKRVTNA